MTAVPWVNAWRDEPDDKELDRIVERPACRIDDTGTSPDELAQTFVNAAQQIFLCDTQSRRLLRMMLSAGRAHVKLNFPSVSHFDRHVVTEAPWISLPKFPIGISGLSGIGKTQLQLALGRLAASRTLRIETEILANVELKPMWCAKLSHAGGVADVLAQFLDDDARLGVGHSAHDSSPLSCDTVSRRVAKSLNLRTRVRSYRDGVAMIGLDELQFGANGSGCAWVTSLILRLMSYGPLVVYNTNFSLLHNLLKGNNEVTRRLLSNVTEMLPFGADDSEWRRFVQEVMSLLPEAWDFSVNQVSGDLLRYTFGVRDNAVDLLSKALITARAERPSCQITARHLEIAYRSASYSVRRNDVELLVSQRHVARNRKDLYSPLTLRAPAGRNTNGIPKSYANGATTPPSGSSDPTPSTKVVPADEAIRAYEKRVLDAMHEEQMQAPARREVEQEKGRRRVRVGKDVVVPIRKDGGARKLAVIIGAAADLIED